MKTIKIMSLLSLLGIFACGSGYKNLNTEEFANAISDGSIALVDVRTPDEYAARWGEEVPPASSVYEV